MSHQLLLGEEGGSICVAAAALERLVVQAAEGVDGARVRRPRRSVDVSISDATVAVSLELAAAYGTVLPELAQAVQASVAAALTTMCGLGVTAVDVSIEELR